MNKEVLVQVGNNRLAVPSFERAGERERASEGARKMEMVIIWSVRETKDTSTNGKR